MNTEMASAQGSYSKSELYVYPVARNRWVPDYNYWAFLIITLISIN